METGRGPGPDHLTHFEKLVQQPEKYHLFSALRILEAENADRPRFGRSARPREDRMRLCQQPELAFPPATVFKVEPPTAHRRGRLINRFFGLFGPHGPLPIHLTEFARDRLRNRRDPTLVAFADMLTHRVMGLFYRAWVSAEPAPSFDRPEDDPISDKVAAIAGYSGKSLAERDRMPDVAKRHFAGHLGAGARSAHGLSCLLEEFFEVPVEVEEFVGTWLRLEPEDQWAMGMQIGLGHGTGLGEQVWTRNGKFRLKIGPVSLNDYRRLLPGTGSLERLRDIVRNYVGDTVEWDVNLILKKDEVPPAIIGETATLGHAMWCGSRPEDAGDANELYLNPNTRAA
jgi:type VI secretion system protein ImpH